MHKITPATPKQGPLAQLLAFPLSPYEQSSLHTLALPSQFSSSSSSSNVNMPESNPSGPVLSSQAISILQDLLCVRAIQSGDYVRAIKLDRQFSSVSSSLGSGMSSSNIASQATFPGRDIIDRKSIIQDLFATLPPAERTLLEDEIGKVATGVRANASSTQMPRQGASAPARRPLTAELSLSASWEDVGASAGSPASSPSVSLASSVVGAGFAGKSSPVPVSTIGKAGQSTFASPFASRVPQPAFGRQAPPTPKFTAFGSPIPSTVSAARGVITERAQTLYSTSAMGGPSTMAKPAIRVSLFDTAGSAKNAPNAFYKPPSAPGARTSLDVGNAPASSSTPKNTEQDTIAAKQNGKTQGDENDDEDASMGSGSDVEIIVEDHRDESGGDEQEEEVTTEGDEDVGNFLTHDQSSIADLTLIRHHVDEVMDDDNGAGPVIGFSVFSGSKKEVQNGGVGEQGKKGMRGSEHASHTSPPHRPRVSPSRGDESLNISTRSTTSRPRAPPGAFHPEEEEDDDDRHEEIKNDPEEEDEGNDHPLQTTPVQSPRRSTRTRRQSETPSHPSGRSQPPRGTKGTASTTGSTRRQSARSRKTSSSLDLSHSIPGSLIDEDDGEHEQDDGDHTDTHGDADTEMDEQEEEDDGVAPLPPRPSRRTRSSGLFNASTKSKPSARPTAPAKATATKGKARAWPEVKTPARRSSRLSIASSTSPDHTDVASPTKGRKSTGSRASNTGNSSGTVAKRSSVRWKR